MTRRLKGRPTMFPSVAPAATAKPIITAWNSTDKAVMKYGSLGG